MVFGLLILLILLSIAYCTEETYQKYVRYMEKKTLWCACWVSLGILSLLGLGTGLHTFLLYLGPHIASVTLAAHECGSVDFPEPPYPDQIICPQHAAAELGSDAEPVGVESVGVGPAAVQESISLWTIMSKVRLEACVWISDSDFTINDVIPSQVRTLQGTAIGELPPYFMAWAARLSGADPDDEDHQTFETTLDQSQCAQPTDAAAGMPDVQSNCGTGTRVYSVSWGEFFSIDADVLEASGMDQVHGCSKLFERRGKCILGKICVTALKRDFCGAVKKDRDFATRANVAVQKIIHKVGFLGILACASIPNPLWTLSGPIVEFFWCNTHRESSYQNAHSETVCDRHLQQTNSGVDGVPHRHTKALSERGALRSECNCSFDDLTLYSLIKSVLQIISRRL
ncbi:hypothetical protein F2P81_008541 [Scophthalmus maximus]|uniref:Vacuole membrane protein 1-like n=1 Tax=Scophthalmus maximus TaxID=52904 RepID=A0A6A4SWX9_SCOMX|nr:hypothetical protein F2P81_008541 [Scophthalmus maximus]